MNTDIPRLLQETYTSNTDGKRINLKDLGLRDFYTFSSHTRQRIFQIFDKLWENALRFQHYVGIHCELKRWNTLEILYSII